MRMTPAVSRTAYWRCLLQKRRFRGSCSVCPHITSASALRLRKNVRDRRNSLVASKGRGGNYPAWPEQSSCDGQARRVEMSGAGEGARLRHCRCDCHSSGQNSRPTEMDRGGRIGQLTVRMSSATNRLVAASASEWKVGRVFPVHSLVLAATGSRQRGDAPYYLGDGGAVRSDALSGDAAGDFKITAPARSRLRSRTVDGRRRSAWCRCGHCRVRSPG